MNRFLILLTFLTLTATSRAQSQVQLVSDDENATVVRFQLDDFSSQSVQTPNGEAFIISIEGGTPILKAGAPELPKLSTSILLEDQVHTQISVIGSEYTDYPNWEIAPSKGNLLRNTDPSSVPYVYGSGYDVDQFFPQNLSYLRDPFIFREVRGQSLVVHPIQYNPVSKVLRVYEEIVVKVKKSEGNAINPLIRPDGRKPLINEPYSRLYNERFLNYDPQSARYEQVSELGNMLIIAHGDYISILDPYVEWKRQKGIPTEVVDVATIGNDAAAIYDYLSDYYHSNGVTYVLLVGDENTVATAQTSSDNACDHCYSYQDGDDHFNEFFIGRFNAANAAQVQTMVDRTLEYEKTPFMDVPEWFRSGITSGSSQGPGDDGEYDYEHLNVIKSQLLDFTYGAVYEFYDGDQSSDSPTPGDATADGAGNPQNTAIGDVINDGTSIYNYCGHGSHASLSSGNFNVNTVYNHLNNRGMYPFMIAVACCVGDFQNDFGSGDCLGDAWIRATDGSGSPTGGIGGLFSSILQSWSPPMEGQDEMNLLLVEAGQHQIRHTMGGVAVHGFGAMIEEYGGGGEEMADTWNIFGDPSVVLWTDTPADLTVDHVPVVNVGTAQLQVYCDVEDALVGLYYQGDVLGSGLVSGGVATIDFDPVLVPDQILVTVTAFNHLPYQGPVEVIVSQGPYVLMAEYELDDSAGNNNQLADYSEAILMNLTLENVGSDFAPNVVASLSTSAPNITITQNEMTFGNIAQDQEVTENGAFAFTVADFILDQEVVFFELSLQSDAETWNYSIPVKLHAPVLEAQPTYTIVDDQFGNNNGRMDNEEIFNLFIPVKNTGHSLSPNAIGALSTASPYVTVLTPTFDMGALAEQGGEGEAKFILIVAPDVPMSEVVEFQFTVAANLYSDDHIYEGAINLIVEDFEDGMDDEFGWEQLTNSEWFETDYSPYLGISCMQSGPIPNNANTQVSMNVEVLEPGQISFARRVSTEDGWDFMRFYINGVKVGEWSGEESWGEVSFNVPTTGSTEFLWSYEKDQYVFDGEDAAWIDEIILPLIKMSADTTVSDIRELNTVGSFSVFPNPAQTSAQVSFDLEQSAAVSLTLFNAHGQQVLSVFEGQLSAGKYLKGFSVAEVPAGVYWLSLRAGEEVRTLKLVR